MHFAPRRQLGRTGFIATILGIGDVADRRIDSDVLVATLRRAIDAGLNVIDTAPSYEDGYSELIVGQAVHGRRERMFVITKIDHIHQPVAPQVDESLGRLGLEFADCFVLHAVSKIEDWQKAAETGGAMEQLGQAVRAGKARFRGISSHHPSVLRAAIASGMCDLVMFPVGPYVDRAYVDDILPLAHQNHIATVAFKTFGAGKLLGDTDGYNQPLSQRPHGKISSGGRPDSAPILPHMTVEQCLHYTLTCDPDVSLLGMSFPNEQDAAFASVRSFTPLSPNRMAEMRFLADKAIRDKGPIWWNPDAA